MATTRIYRSAVRYIRDGEPVDAGVTNRPVKDLHGNVAALRSVVEELKIGRAIIIRDERVDQSLVAGQPVYFDAVNRLWRPARATLVSSGTDAGTWSYGPESFVGGVLESRVGSRGSVVLTGACKFPVSWTTQAFDGPYRSGPVYLSRSTAGKLSTGGQLSVRVGMVSGPDENNEYTLLVMPSSREALTAHSHLRVELFALPAGKPNRAPEYYDGTLIGEFYPGGPYPDFKHRVDETDITKPGWLPVDHSSFSGLNKPAGAKFGYNIKAHSELAAVWPPSPAYFAKSAVITLDGGIADAAQVIANESGIWWMTDAYGKAPWSVNYRPYFETPIPTIIPPTFSSSSNVSSVSSESSLSSFGSLTPGSSIAPFSQSSSSSAPVPPLPLRQPKITLWFNSVVSQTETTFVTALTSEDKTVRVTEPRGGILDLSVDQNYIEQSLLPVATFPTKTTNLNTYADNAVWAPLSTTSPTASVNDILYDVGIPGVIFTGQNARAYYMLDVRRTPINGYLDLSIKLRLATGNTDAIVPTDAFSIFYQILASSKVERQLPTTTAGVRQLQWSSDSLRLPIGNTSYVDIETDSTRIPVDAGAYIVIVVRSELAGDQYVLGLTSRIRRT